MTDEINTQKKSRRKWRMPSAFGILFGLIAVVALLTWVVPSGQYTQTEPTDGSDPTPIAGTYKEVPKVHDVDGEATDVRQGFWEVFQAPILGTTEAIDVVLFVLIIGGFLGVTMKTGALDAFLGRVVSNMKGREKWLIPVLMTLFALGGTTYGMQEETIAFYALVIPVMLAAGYNGMVAALVIILGAGVGVLGSTINPFSTGIASGFANVSIGDGIIERLVILVLSLLAAIWFVMRYAAKVKKGEYKDDSRLKASAVTTSATVPELTGRRKAVLTVFGLAFVIMVIAVIPWEFKFGITFFADMANWLKDIPVLGLSLGAILPLGDWWFNELSMLFFVAALIIGLIYYTRMPSKEGSGGFVDTFIAGARDLLAVALIIGLARGISVIMNHGEIMATFINYGEQLLHSVPSVLLPAVAFVVYLPLSFLIPSTSGLATASMPIMAPLADFANIDRHLIVTAFATSEGVINLIAPTVASVVGGLALAKVAYGTYLRRTWKLMLVLSVISLVVMIVSALI
ncbi:hypothetical protein RAAC3_TM7C00001G0376 [Candidatus Saccharibacteria bacterium RAAC3_TM7_1]|nr:hypothetical protein RAAC3_TM7C00001G0376 [Candidatus Saccharibacteria bacterium RAAC3_TM7_1]